MGYNCNCSQGVYGTNMWNVNGQNPTYSHTCGHPQSCNGCIDIVKGICLIYTGTNLINLGVNTNETFNAILGKLDAIKAVQDTKFSNALIALNDINDRLNELETEVGIVGGGSHIPYTLL